MKKKYQSIDFPYIGEMPHKIDCVKCGRMFYTGSRTGFGICQKCDPEFGIEMSEPLAKRIIRMWGLNLS